MFGGMANPDHDDCIRIIHKALDSGINFIDTADGYSSGESEEIVGKALKGRRDNIVLATKVHGPMGDDPNQQGNSRRWITQRGGGSLRRLQTDYIDLYQIHRPAGNRHRGDALGAHRSDAGGQGARDRLFDVSCLGDRGGAVGCRAPRSGAFPHRAAALFDPQPQHRARGTARLPEATGWA